MLKKQNFVFVFLLLLLLMNICSVRSYALAEQVFKYSCLEIIEPTDNFTFVPDECGCMGCMTVKVKLTPELQKNHQFQVVLDGKPYGCPQTAPEIHLEDINRGEHTIQVQVIDDQKKVLITSDCVAFFMQRVRVLRRLK